MPHIHNPIPLPRSERYDPALAKRLARELSPQMKIVLERHGEGPQLIKIQSIEAQTVRALRRRGLIFFDGPRHTTHPTKLGRSVIAVLLARTIEGLIAHRRHDLWR